MRSWPTPRQIADAMATHAVDSSLICIYGLPQRLVLRSVLTALGIITVVVVSVAVPAATYASTAIPANARQLLVVSSPTADPPDYLATFRAYARATADAPWRQVFQAWTAETGSGHLVAAALRREGDHATPIGVFAVGATMYGNDPDPGGLHYRYHQLACGDWWDEDPYSAMYSRFLHVTCGTTPAFAAWSEPLWTETIAYPYFAVIRFNMGPIVAGAQALGSGIFLHSWVDGPTQGCVALPQNRLLLVLRWLRPEEDPVIDIGVGLHVS